MTSNSFRDSRSSDSRELVVQVLATADTFRRRLTTVLEPSGLSLPQYNVLRILRGAGGEGLPTMEVADRMLEKTPGVTRLIDRLEKRGWVERSRSTEDRRVVWCALTPAGRELLDDLDEPFARCEQQCAAGLSADQRRRLVELLGALR